MKYVPGAVKLIPDEVRNALDVRFMDRFFDNYVSTPQQKIVVDSLREAENRDRQGVDEARPYRSLFSLDVPSRD
jgi:glutathione S-transferase